jgi:hypothetical protein
MSYNSFGASRQLLNGAEVGRLKIQGVIKEEEYAYVEGDVVMAENIKTQDRRVVGRAAELLTESGAKRVLKG